MTTVSTGPLLTIAIPTYNRARLLALGLELVTDQIAEDVELRERVDVLVIDNASTDDTREVVAAFRERHSFVGYRQNDSNVGIDGNIFRCSKFAQGRYVHFLSDDDVVLPGGVRAVVEQIERHPEADFFFLNLRPFADSYRSDPLGTPVFPSAHDKCFATAEELIDHCWIYLTFVSSFVFRRSAWAAGERHEGYVGTEIYLAHALFDMLALGNPTVFVARPVIGMRCHYGGNFRLFRALALQWRRLLLEHAVELGFDRRIMVQTFKRSIRDDLPNRVIDHRVHYGEIDRDSRSWIVDSTRDFACAWWRLYPLVFAPRWLLKLAYRSVLALRGPTRSGGTITSM